MNKLIVILGPTASGKSDLAVKLALKYNGEIISADSRQVYKGMDIGSGKITPDTKNSSNFSTGRVKKKYIFTHKGIPHYCIDVASPKRRFTVAQYQKLARKAIREIWQKGKIPILCGGTGLYIQSIVDSLVIPEVPPDAKLRARLEKLSTEKLFAKLQKLDPRRAQNIDRHNRRRLIRALEIVIKTGKPVPPLHGSLLFPPYGWSSKSRQRRARVDFNTGTKNREFKNPSYSPFVKGRNVLQLGTVQPPKKLKKLIKKRLLKRLRQGMVNEARNLQKSGLSWKRLEEFGLEYRAIAQYLQKKTLRPRTILQQAQEIRGRQAQDKLLRQEMLNKIQKESEQYAKRQMTWFQRDKRIKWVKNYKEAEKLTRQFLF